MSILASTLRERFQLLYDKVESAYYDSIEESEFANAAILAVVKEIVYNKGRDRQMNGKLDLQYEDNSHIAEYLDPLIRYPQGQITLAGELTKAELSAVMGGSEKVMYLLGLSLSTTQDGTYYPAHYVRHNDLGPMLRNYHKEPRNCDPLYVIGDTKYKLYPQDTQFYYKATVLKYPDTVDLDPLSFVDSDLPESMTNQVVMKMVELAGIPTRNMTIYQTSQQQLNQTEV